ncbi:4-(cytidine 5'-diphospho)-2-C-methyl-D-erythritol kinase [Methyloversatilis sp.]|uniref:4-(cytidine 5'-diphospho)-2-C-methyl-D-erythritol kinase n=1 Tax=Methyloversatilis sp. TaxID=2569862 RepID=UPI0027337C7C|nr:4-(cytidine 5'-diphospho)-2-C-methyl-D-erythritol kinase [Methyloversatilis sp.]MDP2869433.1 4-(cytidine 5'-diphospho)-2-C-methyl-D-erythritol kinase [Methyloversatilis sp.]MDP3289915.1 4-(cytidine 5'-diphospho)-2-C-methyl-D-erythritol kinase [Methyloversatilis sp.]MDP3455293.1 4-(cytidine 5'-diphospho)-2-C-methyl-D-erythritol kinase [Methyloversatilis sp.]MDP3578487.1 4-(cytidine 5'-diphospho)-2-C-methyl-D-erythritol kinase [Methyloversatilis sp.]
MSVAAPNAVEWGKWLDAPAKINLFLHVIGRRTDGYHLLQTAFRFLDFGDRLRFTPRTDGAIRRVNPLAGVAEEDDLCVRAARLLQSETGCTHGVDIELEKRLPMGGGLGGGSSDAATVLIALNRLWQLGLPRESLQALGLRLGADVPVFVFGRSAFAEGVGERLQAVALPAEAYVVVAPGVSVPTPRIFAAPELTRNTEPCKIADFAEVAAQQRLFGRNDLQPVAEIYYPAVARAIRLLGDEVGDQKVRMSGSGACVFAQCPSREQGETVLAAMSGRWPEGWQGFVACGVDVHPLYGKMPGDSAGQVGR